VLLNDMEIDDPPDLAVARNNPFEAISEPETPAGLLS
jgi:hypothetical protein